MTKEIFEKATELQRNINSLTHIIDDVEKEHHWISLVSARYENEVFSKDFYKSLLEFAKTKLEEYQKEFNELQDSDISIIDSNINWISVDDKLPPEPRIGEDGYIVQEKNVREPFSAYWDGERWTDSNYEPIDDVIAWMPLPNKYISEE